MKIGLGIANFPSTYLFISVVLDSKIINLATNFKMANLKTDMIEKVLAGIPSFSEELGLDVTYSTDFSL